MDDFERCVPDQVPFVRAGPSANAWITNPEAIIPRGRFEEHLGLFFPRQSDYG